MVVKKRPDGKRPRDAQEIKESPLKDNVLRHFQIQRHMSGNYLKDFQAMP